MHNWYFMYALLMKLLGHIMVPLPFALWIILLLIRWDVSGILFCHQLFNCLILMSIRLLQLPFISLTAQIVTIENYWSLPACLIWSFQPRPHLIFFNSLMIVDPPTKIAAQVQIAVTSSRSRTMIEVPLAIRSNPLNAIMKVSMASLPRLETPMPSSQNTLTPSLPVPEEFLFAFDLALVTLPEAFPSEFRLHGRPCARNIKKEACRDIKSRRGMSKYLQVLLN